MKARLTGLLFASLLALGSSIGVASAVSFDRSYADPASDVVELWASNMTPVLTDGNLTMSPFPDSVNVLRLSSADDSRRTFTLAGDGHIRRLPSVSTRSEEHTAEPQSR